MRNIRYIGNSAINKAYYPQTGIIWTPGKVDTVLDDKVAAEMLLHPDVFEDAGDSSAVTQGAEGAVALTPTGLAIGGSEPTSAQRAAVRAGIGADLLTLAEMMQRTVSAANPFDSPAMASPPTIVTTGGTDPAGPKSLAYFDHPELFKWSGATQGAAGAWLQNSGGYARPRMPRMAPAGAQVANQGGWACSVRTDAPIIKFNVQNTNTFFVSVDGERTNDAGYTSTGNFSLWIPLATRKLRTITIYSQQQAGLLGITVGESDTVVSWSEYSPTIVVLSDSYFDGTTSPQLQRFYSLPGALRARTGWNVVCNAIGGSGYVRETTADQAATNAYRWEDVALASPDAVAVCLGYNDAANGIASADVLAAALVTLAGVRAAVDATVPIVVFGPWPGTLNLSAGLLAIEGAIESAVLSVGGDRIKFVPVSTGDTPWVSGDGDTNSAGTVAGNSTVITGDDGYHLGGSYGVSMFAEKIAAELVSAIRG